MTYTYDGDFKGALSSVSNGVSATTYTHDGFGRITGSAQVTGANRPYVFAYGYSLTDALTSMTYPSGRKVNYALDAADRVTAVQNVNGGGNYASSIGYTPGGGFSGMTLGNGLTQTYSWNDRLQPTGLTAAGAGTTLLGLGFYPCTGQLPSCASGNNGNLQSQTINMPGLNLTQGYSYDHLNRLTGAQETGGSGWTQTFGYDVLGNRWVASNTGLPNLTQETPQSSSWYSATAPNRYAASTGWTYDNAGNVLTVGGMARSFTYDAENRQVTACLNCASGSPTGTYAYDGNGQRVSKTAGGQTTIFVYDAWGKVAAEYTTGGTVASACGTPTCYVTADHLGSTRMLTGNPVSTASVVRYDYAPFGQEITAGYGGRTISMGYVSLPDATDPKYTGQERDQETALDWFQVRHMSGAQGRFQSPDPANAGASLDNPQSWNGYGYVGNNPLTYTDPSGMYMCASCIAAGSGNPIVIAAAAIIDAGAALASFFGFGGGGGPPPTISPSLATPSSPISGSASEQGGVFGSGNISPFVFSWE
ncbi:MAG: RHS repeat-associated core domain-containing protein, partial [Acidobacteriota bacterium]|nr:RHS repeat-associated core domain-containing protein [Acidobacteriota bacterium]